jgi:hypothetical protein
MRALRIWTDILEWRWTPAVGLALGALFFVSLALLVIPDRVGNDESSRSISTFQSLRKRTSAFAASIAPSQTDSEATRDGSSVSPSPRGAAPGQGAQPGGESDFPRRGFSPPLEHVEAPPPPPQPEVVVQSPAPIPPATFTERPADASAQPEPPAAGPSALEAAPPEPVRAPDRPPPHGGPP